MSILAIPEPIAQLQRQLDQFRSTQPGRRKLPESVWQAAVGLAREYGVYSVAHPLGLDYMGLKKRLGGASRRRRKASKPAFVELIAPHAACCESASSSSSPWLMPSRPRASPEFTVLPGTS